MTDAFDNDQWTETHTLDKIDDIHYPPNWLRFDAAELPQKITGKSKVAKLYSTDKEKDISDNIQTLSVNYKNEAASDNAKVNDGNQNCILNLKGLESKLIKTKIHSLPHHYSCLPDLRKRAVISRNESLISLELDKGIYSLIERGMIQTGEDVTLLVRSGSRLLKLPNIRFTKAKTHDSSLKRYKCSNIFSPNALSNPGVKFLPEPIVKQKSILYPALEVIPSVSTDKPIPANPPCTPKQSATTKNRNIWNLASNKSRHKYILGRDTPDKQVLTGWVIPFKDGHAFEHGPAYQEFINRYKNTNLHLSIQWIIQNLESLLQKHGIQYADIFCHSIIYLAQQPLIWPLKKDDLILCIVNPDEIVEKMNDPSLKFKNKTYARVVAAIVIQRMFRTWSKRRDHLLLLERVWAATIFQKYWKIKTAGRALRASFKVYSITKYKTRLVTESTKGCIRLINNLKRDWIQIFSSSQKVIIQVCNWTTPEQAIHLPNFDFARCFPLNDPSIKMIFICPFQDQFKKQSLMNLFDHAHREKNPIRQDRVLFIVPELSYLFTKNTSMAAVACMSTRMITKIKEECEGKDAILYNDSIGDWDISLSATLQIPIFGSAPDLFDMLSTKSKARKFLETAGITLSGALFSSASDITALLVSFIKAYHNHPKASYFALIRTSKLNLDYPAGNLPIAFIDVKSFTQRDNPSLDSFAKSFTVKQAQSSSKKSAGHVPAKMNSIIESAIAEFKSVTKLVSPGFSGFESFIENWKESKGFFQVVSCADPRKLRIVEFGFTIDVDGNLELLVSTEMILDKKFGVCGFFIPQEQLTYDQSSELFKKISAQCFSLGMLGKFTLEVWCWENENGEKEHAATNLKAYFSTTILRGQTVILASGCQYSSSTDKMIYQRSNIYVETKTLQKAKFFNMDEAMKNFTSTVLTGIAPLENRVAFYLDHLSHSTVDLIGSKTAHSFFESHGVTFDYWSKSGSILPTNEGLTKSSIPIITIQKDRYSCLEKTLTNLNITYSLLSSKKHKNTHTYLPITTRTIYELLLEKYKISLKSPSQSSLDSLESLSDSQNSLETLDISTLLAKYSPISATRLLSPADDDSIPRFQISTETVKLLSEGIPSNIEAEFDPTFHKPVLLPPWKRQLKKTASFTDSTESISYSKRNSIDSESNSSLNLIDSIKKQSQMPTFPEDNPG